MFFMDRRIIVWNCRGAGSDAFGRAVKMMCKDSHPDVLVLLETRVEVGRAVGLSKKLGFDKYYTVAGDGYAGGIWLMWKSSNVDIGIIEDHYQFCHTSICFPNDQRWFGTFVYASPNVDGRKIL